MRAGCDILLYLCYDTAEHRDRLLREKQLTVNDQTQTQTQESSTSSLSSSSASLPSAIATATAKPTGTFEQIAHAWRFADILTPSQIPSEMPSQIPSQTPSQMIPANDEI